MAQCKRPNDLKRLLECPICLERVKNPRILPCFHSFCEICLGQHVHDKEGRGFFMCPICNAKTQIPPGGATGFNRNTYLDDMCLLFPEEHTCDFCLLRGNECLAVSKCVQCDDHLCEECAVGHCSSKLTSDHRVVSLDESDRGEGIGNAEARSSKSVYICSVHAGEVVQLFCDRCTKPLCRLCAEDHRHHKQSSIEEAEREIDDVIRGSLNRWKLSAEYAETVLEERMNELRRLDVQERQLMTKIKKVFTTVKDEISKNVDCRMNKTVEAAQERVAVARKQVQILCDEAKTNKLSIDGVMVHAQNLLDSADGVVKLKQFYKVKHKMKNVDHHEQVTEVTTTVFHIEPEVLNIPDVSGLKVKMVAQMEKKTLKRNHEHALKEKAVLVGGVRTQIGGDECYSCYDVAVNEEWFITTDYNRSNINVFDREDGRFLHEVNHDQYNLLSPRGVACNDDGEIFVTVDGILGVVRYNVNGYITKVAKNLYGSFAFITCYGDQLVLTDYAGERLLITDFNCNIKRVVTKTDLGLLTFKPLCVSVDREGHLVVSGEERVLVIDYKKPAVIHSFCDKLRKPWGVCVDEWGNILVADFINSHVVLFAVEGGKARVSVPITSADIVRPVSVAVTAPGEVGVLENASGKLKLFKYLEV